MSSFIAPQTSRVRHARGAETSESSAAGREAPLSWDFSRIPVHPPLSAGRSQISPRVTGSRLPIQAKLAVGSTDDPLEHEADRVADQMMRMPTPMSGLSSAPPQVSRKCAACEEEDKTLQKKEAGPAAPALSEAPASVHETLRATGQLLDAASRAYFEPRFGCDFSSVRVHTGAQAEASASDLNCLAYTVGRNIVFGAGAYGPDTSGGRRLMAHELTHVVQQRAGDTALVRRAPSKDKATGGSAISPDEQLFQDLWGDDERRSYQQYKGRAAELAQAHQIYLATGQIAQTWDPFPLIEIKEGKLMTRAERYDAMLEKQGKDNADLTTNDWDAEYLSEQEFHDELFARHRAEWDQCDEDHWFKGPTFKCQREVDEKYGGTGFKPWKEAGEAQDRQRNQVVLSKMGGVVNSGAFATIGRATGALTAWGLGNDPLAGSEKGAAVGGILDTGLSIWAGVKSAGRVDNLPDPVPGQVDVGDIVSTPTIAGPLQVEAVVGDTAVLTPLTPSTAPGRTLPAARTPFAPSAVISEVSPTEAFSRQAALPSGSIFLSQPPAAAPAPPSSEQAALPPGSIFLSQPPEVAPPLPTGGQAALPAGSIFLSQPPAASLVVPSNAEFDAAFARLESGQNPDQGAMLGDLMFHGQRGDAVDQLRAQVDPTLRTRPGRTPDNVAVNPQPGYQSAHTTAQSVLRNLPTYNPDTMITRLLPTGRGHSHTKFDQFWQAEFRQIRQVTGRTTTTAQELFEVTARAARQSGAFAPAEAESMVQLIQEDLYVNLALSPNQVLRMPGT